MIEEEYDRVLNEVNQYHNPQTGFFDKKKAGNVYSLSKRAVRDNKLDPKLAKRGTYTANDKVRAKFGQNQAPHSCGRQNIDGTAINPKYSCSQYKKKYREPKSEEKLVGVLPDYDNGEAKRQDTLFPGYDGLRQLSNFITETDDGETMINLDWLISELESMRDSMAEPAIVEGRDELIDKCRSLGLKTQQEAFQSILVSLNSIKLASDGKLYDKKESQ